MIDEVEGTHGPCPLGGTDLFYATVSLKLKCGYFVLSEVSEVISLRGLSLFF